MKLLDLISAFEGKSLEFKRDYSSPERVLRTVIAFANTSGGTVLIGVDDETRAVRGIEDPHGLSERLVNLISDSVTPRILPDVHVLHYRNTHVLAVRVHPSAVRPHYLSARGEATSTYVRVGSSNRRADPALIAEMKRFASAEAFDELPVPETDSEAIDFRLASESFASVRQLRPQDLLTLRLTTEYQERQVATNGGILLFGLGRLKRFPDAFIQAGRFAGADRSVMIDHGWFKEPLTEAISSAIAFIEKHSNRGFTVGRLQRTDTWSLPQAAVREAVINAVAHADYSQTGAPIRIAMYDDRLEIENPGLLPFGLSIEDLPQGISRIRNRVIGRVFNELGLIEQWGSGVQRMMAACRDAGLAPPEFQEIGFRFRVTFRLTQEHDARLDDTDRRIMDLVCEPEGQSTRRIAEQIGLSSRATRTRLASLVERGLVLEVGTSPNDPKRRYFAARR